MREEKNVFFLVCLSPCLRSLLGTRQVTLVFLGLFALLGHA